MTKTSIKMTLTAFGFEEGIAEGKEESIALAPYVHHILFVGAVFTDPLVLVG
jgi:hypothetical protein